MFKSTYSVALLGYIFLLSFPSSSNFENEHWHLIDYEKEMLSMYSFTVDWERNTFLRDGMPFRFIAGSFHYSRSHPDSWQRKLRAMRAAGLNTVTTDAEWSLHNPMDNIYVWDGIADLETFLSYCTDEDLLVILKIGPYIGGDNENGGLPYWLMTKYPDIEMRTSNTDFLNEVRLWYIELMSRIDMYLYGKGGPIIMVQIEHNYGSFYACDQTYLKWLINEVSAHVKENAVIFTKDSPGNLKCGHIPGVLATVDIAPGMNSSSTWNDLRKIQPKGPLVNMEFYTGWTKHWNDPLPQLELEVITKSFKRMLDEDANINFYMFCGGTNFGFTAGADEDDAGNYRPKITSYDYDAPLDESGDPTEKYYVLRKIIGHYLPLPNIPVPVPLPKKYYGRIELSACCFIMAPNSRRIIAKRTLLSSNVRTFERLNQYSGLILYETMLPKSNMYPSVLMVEGIRDRGYVYIGSDYIGVLSREDRVFSLQINANLGGKLQILVENQGRIDNGFLNDSKGIVGNVILNNHILKTWNITRYPFESYDDISRLLEEEFTCESHDFQVKKGRIILTTGPAIFYGELNINENEASDTYIDTTGWTKGFAFINGVNLGRYWPVAGTQTTLYVPKEMLSWGSNLLVFIEYENAPESGEVTFTDVPNVG